VTSKKYCKTINATNIHPKNYNSAYEFDKVVHKKRLTVFLYVTLASF